LLLIQNLWDMPEQLTCMIVFVKAHKTH